MDGTLLKTARGSIPAERVLKGGQVFNVFTGERLTADVALCGGVIAGVGRYRGIEEIDVSGKTIVPGFIDAHMHIESTMVTPARLAGEVLPWGTTALIADPHEIANVAGLAGVEYFLAEARTLPLHLFIMLPSCVPSTPFEHSGAVLSAQDLIPLRDHPSVLGLGEVMDYSGVVSGEAGVCEKIDAFRGRMIDGHAPMLSGPDLQAYRCAGILTDHECGAPDEMIAKLRAGFYVLIREGSAARNLEALVRTAIDKGLDTGLLAFCTDDKHIEDIRREGHISYNIRRSIELGLPPEDAYRMATLNPARMYGLRRLGAVAPGYRADLVILDSFEDAAINSVYAGGEKLSQGLSQVDLPPTAIPPALKDTVHLAPITQESLRLRVTRRPTPVIELVPGQISTRALMREVPLEDGCFVPGGEYRKLAVVERHHATGRTGLGILKGFPIHGAIASTVAHDSHNLILVGDNDADMIAAARALERCAGGFALAQEGRIRAALPLPVGGLMSEAPAGEVVSALGGIIRIARDMGAPEGYDPFITLSFLALPVIPELRVTDMGLFDVPRYRFIRN